MSNDSGHFRHRVFPEESPQPPDPQDDPGEDVETDPREIIIESDEDFRERVTKN